MPKFHELYGEDPLSKDPLIIESRRDALCPFTENTCDGGGNRHQTKIKLEGSRLRELYAPGLSSIIPAVCSIEYKDTETWIVCPRRLLGLNPPADKRLIVNFSLQQHERDALIKCGVPTGVELGVWSEVYLQYGEDETTINYHFDFVISELYRGESFEKLFTDYEGVSKDDLDELIKYAKAGKYYAGKFDASRPLDFLPNLKSPIIIEVMTASTSGSDREARTDIATSFEDAMLGENYSCPGINKRQVWGRMATQLFAKSALAEEWGGKTIWLVQDELLKNIELTTKLQLKAVPDGNKETINFLSMAYEGRERGASSLKVAEYLQKDSGLSFGGSNKCSDILLSKVNPGKLHLLKAILRRELSAVIYL